MPEAPHMTPGGHRLLVIPMVPGLEAAAQSRRAVRDLLQGSPSVWIDPELIDDACLLVSELVANAVLHAGSPVELVVDLDTNRIVVEVLDPSHQIPQPGPAEPWATSGRGLDLVANVADSWGVETTVPGKSVWFSLTNA